LLKNLLDGAAFLRLNAMIQILESPAQSATQCEPHTAFPGTHEAHKEYGSRPGVRLGHCGLGLFT
jgi:hypothetical protein